MNDERQASWRETGERAQLIVVRTARAEKGEAKRITEDIAEWTSALAAEARRRERARRCRELAHKVRSVMREVETDVNVDAHPLRAFAIRLENMSDMLDGRRL
jgi:hypothetical protein